ncbi:MAG: DUF1127 domain-containing protein [Paracoccaceae bacterium]|nr:DUF1127 domain-containing protein [Paracoccaceae bacterium]
MALIDHFATTTQRISGNRVMSLIALVGLWRSRRALARLDTRALEDIGVTRNAADLEANRPFWDVPETWRNQ